MINQRSVLSRYFSAIIAVCLATTLLALFFIITGLPLPAVAIFLIAIGFSAWFGGAGPGILSLLLSVVISDQLRQSMFPETELIQRLIEAFALVIGGILTMAMMIFRATQAKFQIERELDASERRRTEQNLLQERHRMQVLLENSPDRIYFKDLKSRFVLVSPSLVWNFKKKTASEVIGKTDFDIFTVEHAQPAFDDEQEIIRTGKAIINKEEKETWPDGHVTWASTTKVPYRDPDGTIVGTFGISRDITVQKEAEDLLRQAKLEAEAATLAKSQFLANMSHELRTPLGAVVGMAEILLESGLNPEQHEFAEIIHNSGNGLVAMLNDILDFSKNEAGHMDVETIPFDLYLAIDEVVHLHAANAENHALELIERIAPKTPNRLIGDPGRLRQILSNLIGNAIKFTDAGHVYIDVSGTVADDNKVQLTIKVIDTGIGIEADKLKSIFDKFTQADNSMTRRYGGTGLGLAICKQLAEGMGGSLAVESTVGEGSTFILNIFLPIANATATALPVDVDITGVRVMIIEANAVHRRVMEEQVQSWGCDCICFQNAQNAIAAEKTNPSHVAIIDAHLPDMHGLDLGPLLRRQQSGEQLGLILLTSIGQRGDAKMAESAGYNGYLVKPVRQVDLRDAIGAVRQAQKANTLTGIVTRHSLAENRGHSSSKRRKRTDRMKPKLPPKNPESQ